MGLSQSRLAYDDCYEIWDAAIEQKGVRVPVDSHESAIYLRMRMHHSRHIDRKANQITYAEGHPLHGRSAYDRFQCTIRTIEGKVYVYVRPITLEVTIEPIPDEAPAGAKSLNGHSPMGESEPGRDWDRDRGGAGEVPDSHEQTVQRPQGTRRV